MANITANHCLSLHTERICFACDVIDGRSFICCVRRYTYGRETQGIVFTGAV